MDEDDVACAVPDAEAGDDDDPEELDLTSRQSTGDGEPAGDFDEDFYSAAIRDIDD